MAIRVWVRLASLHAALSGDANTLMVVPENAGRIWREAQVGKDAVLCEIKKIAP